MYEPIIIGCGIAILALMCLPIASIQKLILEILAWTLRFAMLALLACGVYLWYRPAEMPVGVTNLTYDYPQTFSWLPAPGSPLFAPCVTSAIVAFLVPVLAVLDVCRKLSGRRLYRIRQMSARHATPMVVETPVPVQPVIAVTNPPLRPIQRRVAADAMASAGRRLS